MRIYTFIIPVYGRLVHAGIYTVDSTDKTKKIGDRTVCQWLVEQTSMIQENNYEINRYNKKESSKAFQACPIIQKATVTFFGCSY